MKKDKHYNETHNPSCEVLHWKDSKDRIREILLKKLHPYQLDKLIGIANDKKILGKPYQSKVLVRTSGVEFWASLETLKKIKYEKINLKYQPKVNYWRHKVWFWYSEKFINYEEFQRLLGILNKKDCKTEITLIGISGVENYFKEYEKTKIR